jgi:hypothetical protein
MKSRCSRLGRRRKQCRPNKYGYSRGARTRRCENNLYRGDTLEESQLEERLNEMRMDAENIAKVVAASTEKSTGYY